ncbi:MAG: fatty acid--CoA ligase [Desulfobacterales bacterium]|nr:fatty acid--CoA ligase [Desulfobacterales bacterium]
MTQGPRITESVNSAYEYPLLVKHLLYTSIITSPDQEIVYRDAKRFTYRDLNGRIRRLASGLSNMGVKAGDIIAVLDWDSYRYLECYFAIPGIGAVLHCVNVRLSPEQILFTMQHAEDTVVMVHEDFVAVAAQLKDQLPSVKKWILLRETDQPMASDMTFDAEYETLLNGGTENFEFADFDENAMATLFYTTGTTGEPKGVYFSHRQLVLHTLGVCASGATMLTKGLFKADDVYMPITPMFHVHAWGLPYIATMMGVKQVYPGRYEPEMLFKLLMSEKVTFSHCVPTILQMLVTSPEVKNADLTGWKVVIGGSALPRGLADAAMNLGIDIYTGYGMSETCPILTIALPGPEHEDADRRTQLDIRTATGRPVYMVDLKIVDPDMNPQPMDGKSTGEIVVRTPWLTQGYFKAMEKGEQLWASGYLHTGDVGHMDASGYVRITDRIKDVIKTGGEWVSSLEVESLISQHPSVAEVAVVGVPDQKWGERPVATIVLTDKKSFSEAELRNFIMKFVEEGRLQKYAVPDKFMVVDGIPKTSVGKINKKQIRQQLKESQK